MQLMPFIQRFTLPIGFFVAFFVSVSAMYTEKALLESKGQKTVIKAVDMLQHSSVQQILGYLDSHYADEENQAQNTQTLSDFKQKLKKFAGLKKRRAAVFSTRSATLPLESDNYSEIYIVHTLHEKGQLSYTIGIVRTKDKWYIDRLNIVAKDFYPAPDAENEFRYKISVFCNEEKGIKHTCHKAKVTT